MVAQTQMTPIGNMNTEYRIIPASKGKPTRLSRLYLQFKSKKKVYSWLYFWNKKYTEKDVWRFIPKADYATINGRCLSEEQCPEKICMSIDFDFFHSFYGQEHYINGVYNFPKLYPNINDYFQFLQKENEKYAEIARSYQQPIYLGKP